MHDDDVPLEAGPAQDATVPAAGDAAGEGDDTAADAAGDDLRAASVQVREEADRIAALGTGPDQVEAAERFADAAGRLDEQLGSAARAADDEGRS